MKTVGWWLITAVFDLSPRPAPTLLIQLMKTVGWWLIAVFDLSPAPLLLC